MPLSFSQRLKAGWTKEQLIKYFALSEHEYERIIASLERIHASKGVKA